MAEIAKVIIGKSNFNKFAKFDSSVPLSREGPSPGRAALPFLLDVESVLRLREVEEGL